MRSARSLKPQGTSCDPCPIRILASRASTCDREPKNTLMGSPVYFCISLKMAPAWYRLRPRPARYCSRRLRSRLICGVLRATAPGPRAWPGIGARTGRPPSGCRSRRATSRPARTPGAAAALRSRRRRCASARPGRAARGRSPAPLYVLREDHAVRERLEERGDLALHRLGVALVELHEQRDDAARVQVLLDELEELARVEHRRALHPRVERIRRDRVELLVRRQQEVPRVVDARRATFGLRDDVEVVLARSTWRRRAARAARSRRSSRARRADRSRPRRPSRRRRSRSRAPTSGLRRHERRQVAEHPLQAHVLRLARRLHLAGVVIVEDAVRPLARRRPTRSSPRPRR